MRSPSNLVKNRTGIFYFCIAFPVKVRKIIGRQQARRSLKTSNRSIALLMAREFRQVAEWLFNQIRYFGMKLIEVKEILDKTAKKLFQKYVAKANEVGFSFDYSDTLEEVYPPATVLLHNPTGCAIHSTNFTNDPSESIHTRPKKQ